jgi:hypothetical protein
MTTPMLDSAQVAFLGALLELSAASSDGWVYQRELYQRLEADSLSKRMVQICQDELRPLGLIDCGIGGERGIKRQRITRPLPGAEEALAAGKQLAGTLTRPSLRGRLSALAEQTT